MSDGALRPETIAAHALRAADEATGAVAPPIYLSSTYARDGNYKPKLQENYVRNGNPTLWRAEEAIAALESGTSALLFASGMAGIATLLETVPPGAHVVAPDVMYYGTRDWMKRLEGLGRITLTLFDPRQDGALEAALQKGKTDLVWIETPLNPTWDLIDITAAASAAHAAGAILAVDATATGAVTTNPLKLGADIVFHSATKYLNGHSDVLAGVLVTREETRRWADIRMLRTRMGAPLAPLDCFLLLRGLRTVFVRYRQCSANAMAIARYFEGHPGVERVLYPGLASHPGHAIAARQMKDGFGGMMSLLVKGGFEDARKLCTRLKVIVPATSLGGVESLAEHRKTVEGPASPVPDNLVRLSIGIEHADDLIADLEQALAGV
ncbi:PLP-dependent aspartate aminotransferase family protein [Aestuariivirga sp.]|uniref:trans-sulfuration enzyme family protein n=1 Tax=Aestuariivirga sp. TaxID=2650926 RepID=UPI0025BB55CE|nr:PLP-dependent aspartate aminotransferase family protein [Aestuariivirga sp.]MCA3554176.1 PLP-dependent transferase [Aestuariivirga sp.]